MDVPPAPGASVERRRFDTYHLPLPRRRLGPGALASLLVHALLIAVVFWRGAELVAGGGGPGPLGGGGGSSAERFVTLPGPPAPAAPAVPPPPPPPVITPQPTPEIVDEEPEPLLVPVPVAAASAGSDAGVGPGTGGGQGSGEGGGAGAQTGPGTGGPEGYIVPAYLRSAIMPPTDRPASLRGQRYTVRLWVAADGRVTRVEIAPEIADREYRQRFIEKMMDYRFRPAMTRDGTPIASVYSITVTL